LPLLQPANLDFTTKRLELRIAGNEFGFAFPGQRRGKGVGKTEFATGFEVGATSASALYPLDLDDVRRRAFDSPAFGSA
jgi:hypothetical protein